MSGVDSCQIHLKDEARRRAAAALYPIPTLPTPLANTGPDDYIQRVNAHHLKYADELQAQREFTGPNFKGCVEHVCTDGSFIHVHLRDLTIYSYPVGDVARIKQYSFGA